MITRSCLHLAASSCHLPKAAYSDKLFIRREILNKINCRRPLSPVKGLWPRTSRDHVKQSGKTVAPGAKASG